MEDFDKKQFMEQFWIESKNRFYSQVFYYAGDAYRASSWTQFKVPKTA